MPKTLYENICKIFSNFNKMFFSISNSFIAYPKNKIKSPFISSTSKDIQRMTSIPRWYLAYQLRTKWNVANGLKFWMPIQDKNPIAFYFHNFFLNVLNFMITLFFLFLLFFFPFFEKNKMQKSIAKKDTIPW